MSGFVANFLGLFVGDVEQALVLTVALAITLIVLLAQRKLLVFVL
jgi:hypothetical protein